MMLQKDTKLKSLTEALSNIVIGYPINHFANLVILIPFAPYITHAYNTVGIGLETQLLIFYMGMLFTVISVIRSYFLRRLYERIGKHENGYTLLKRLYMRINHSD